MLSYFTQIFDQKKSVNNIIDAKSQNKQIAKHTRFFGTSRSSISGSKPYWDMNTCFCSGRCIKKVNSFWHADKILSSGTSGFNNPTNLLNSTGYTENKAT